jgi:2-polyprenyl-3-methyl-5-hydroxy-6-metoxy-1,4-benzoquinol methylase
MAQRNGISVCFSRIEDMPYEDNFFDALVCTDVLEHLIDLNLGVKNILSVLKPGGFAFIRTPNQEDLTPYLAPDFPYKFSHFRTFDKPSLRLLFEKLFNCTALETSYAVYLPFPNRSRIQVDFPKKEQLMQYFLGWLRKRSSEWHRKALEKLYKPVEINIVVQKNAM